MIILEDIFFNKILSSEEKAQPRLPYSSNSRPVYWFNPSYLREKLRTQDFLYIFAQNYILVNGWSSVCISESIGVNLYFLGK